MSIERKPAKNRLVDESSTAQVYERVSHRSTTGVALRRLARDAEPSRILSTSEAPVP
jgi:hypothetical protein